jgi:hypothetical protein
MPIIFGWGKITKRNMGQAFQKACTHCNTTEIWNLYIVRTWFTLFFIPIIPYKKQYCVACPNCSSYIELTSEQFEVMHKEILSRINNNTESNVEDSMRYAGKTEAQINYLKEMEEYNKTKSQTV